METHAPARDGNQNQGFSQNKTILLPIRRSHWDRLQITHLGRSLFPRKIFSEKA